MVRELWRQVDTFGFFDLSGTDAFRAILPSGFVSGSSNHPDRMAVIRWVYQECGTVVDTHTADGIKVGLEYREQGVPLLCLETALPAKFEDSIVEALGHPPERPAGYENIEALPQRFEVMEADVAAVKAYIARHAS